MIWRASLHRPWLTCAPCGRPDGVAGVITLVRHGEPALSRDISLDAVGYGAWWARYEVGSLQTEQSPPDDIAALARGGAAVVTSTRPRAMESAALLTNGRPFAADDLYVEAPLPPPPWPPWIKMGPRLWGFFTRFWWWFFDHHLTEESVKQAHVRADLAAGRLITLADGGQDVLLVAHGFFNAMIGRALTARGWRRTFGRGYKYWSVRRFEKP